MNLTARPCSHPRLKAVNYDETYHWVLRCKDCGHETRMSNKEWRARMNVKSNVDMGISDVVDTDSTRLPPIPGSSRLPEL